MKKILSFLLALSLLFSLNIVANASSQPEENVRFYLSDEAYQGISENEEINQAFARQNAALIEYATISQQLTADQLGGAYFDDEGTLHVLVTENIPIPATLTTNICYDEATYSYSQLVDFQNIIITQREEIGFDASGIDQEDNKVVIYCADTLDLDLLYDLIPENSVKIVAEDPDLSDCSTHTVVPGKQITNTTNGTYGSIACSVVWDNSTSNKKYGFMTAGHLGAKGDSVSYDGASMGTITKKQQSGSVDAALIQRGQNSNVFNYGNEVADGKVFSTNGGTFPKNTVIYAYGATTTYMDEGTISGKITDTSFSGTFSNIYFTGLIKTDAVNQGGDSGGPVLTAYGDDYAIIGIMKGLSGGKMVYVNMSSIKTAFDLNVVSP